MIDINCDMGEVNELLKDKTYSKLMDHVTSINVACGGHAGDVNMMRKIIQIAKTKNVVDTGIFNRVNKINTNGANA